MEKLIPRSPAIQTLNPQAGSRPRPFPPPRRRSHLDSASYRTLVRIFSICLEESLNPPQEPGEDPTPALGSAAPEIPERSSACGDSVLDRNVVAEELGRGGSESSECGNPRLDVASVSNLGLDEKFGDGNEGNGEMVNSLVCEGPQQQFGDDTYEALHTMKELGHQGEESGQCVDGGLQEGPVVDFKVETFQQENVCIGEVPESPSDMIFDCSEFIEVQDSILGSAGESQGEVADCISEKRLSQFLDPKDQVTDMVDESGQRNKYEPEDECANGTLPEDLTADFNTLNVSQSRICSSSNELLHDIMNELHRECINPLATNLSPNDLMILKSQEEMSNPMNESVEKHQQKLLDSSMSSFELKQSDKNLLNASVDPDNDEEIEEGQIPGDFLTSDESGPMVHQNTIFEDQKLDKGPGYSDFLEKEGPDCSVKLSKIDCSEENIIPRGISLEADDPFVDFGQKEAGNGHLSLLDRRSSAEMKKSCSTAPVMDVAYQAVAANAFRSHEVNSTYHNKASFFEADKVKTKRKKGAMTEERKAKKKKTKKRKRAEKERKQGVKRLKLQPIVKPKVVKLCNFYLMGRCQQGDLCKFSHDATPLTKSQPCKYFACDSCLKGDDCPFDHQLSKYPCHNFQSKGTCHRGDRCKFSHKIPTIEGSSTSIASNLVSPLTLEKLNVGKQKSMNKKLANGSDPPKTTASSMTLVFPKKLEGNTVKTAKEPMRIPNGIRFISFGNGPSESMKMPVDSLFPEKHGCSQQNLENSLTDGQKSAVFLTEKSLSRPQSRSSVSVPATNTFADNFLKNNNSSSGPAATPVSRSFQSEASDASKILEEFLFGATG